MRTTPWEHVDDREYNEQHCVINGKDVRLYSDRAGAVWSFTVEDGEPYGLLADNETEARLEVERVVR